MNWWWLRRRVHVSWLIAICAVSCFVGVWGAQYIPQGIFFSLGWCLTAVALILTGCWYRFAAVVPLVVIGGCLLGMWRGSIDQAATLPYASLYGHEVLLRGVVAEDIDTAVGGQSVLRLKRIEYEGVSLGGTVWMSTSQPREAQRSDRVTVRVVLKEGFGSFAASGYRAQIEHIERSEPGDSALRIRDRFAEMVRTVIPEPEASLGLGYLLGQRRALPAELDESLRIAGLMHAVVASGYNLTILVRFARRVCMRVSRFTAFAAAGGMIISFIAITGMSPSMSRAGLVAGLSLLAWYYGRRFHPLVLLSLAAGVTTMVQPSYAWGDVGWQLSFTAFAGVMILAPLLQAFFFGDKKPGVIRQIIGETTAAQLATLPILAVTFSEVSLVAIGANAIVLPFVPIAMALVFATGCAAFIGGWFATIVAAPATWLLAAMTWVASFLASQSWALLAVAIDGWGVAMYYVVLIAAVVAMKRITGYQLRDSNIIE